MVVTGEIAVVAALVVTSENRRKTAAELSQNYICVIHIPAEDDPLNDLMQGLDLNLIINDLIRPVGSNFTAPATAASC